MIKIFLVEDEVFALKTLHRKITDLNQDYEIVGTATDGTEALPKIQATHPAIVITDIRMSDMDGLTLIENMKKMHIDALPVIVSGYQEFEYAKQAIKYGVKDYVLKPIQKRQFIHLIETCMNEITDKKAAMHNEHVHNQTNAKAAKTVRKNLLTDLLNCKDEEKIQKINNIEYCKEFLNDKFALCCVIQYKIDENNLDYIDLAIINIIEEILKQENLIQNAIIETYSEGQIVLVFSGCDTEAKLNSIAGAISKAFQSIKVFLKIDVFAGIGDIQFGPTRLYKSFHHACQAANTQTEVISPSFA